MLASDKLWTLLVVGVFTTNYHIPSNDNELLYASLSDELSKEASTEFYLG
jgi:hypothetical protein